MPCAPGARVRARCSRSGRARAHEANSGADAVAPCVLQRRLLPCGLLGDQHRTGVRCRAVHGAATGAAGPAAGSASERRPSPTTRNRAFAASSASSRGQVDPRRPGQLSPRPRSRSGVRVEYLLFQVTVRHVPPPSGAGAQEVRDRVEVASEGAAAATAAEMPHQSLAPTHREFAVELERAREPRVPAVPGHAVRASCEHV